MPRKKVKGASSGPSLFQDLESRSADLAAVSLPDRFKVTADAKCETFLIRDHDTGNEVSVPASSYADIRRALTGLLGSGAAKRTVAQSPAKASAPRKLFGAAAKSAASKQVGEAAAPAAGKPAARTLHGAAARSAETRASKGVQTAATTSAPPTKKLHGAAAASATRKSSGTPAQPVAGAAERTKPAGRPDSTKPQVTAAPSKSATSKSRSGAAPGIPDGWEAMVKGDGFTMTYEADPENGRPGYRVEANGRVVARVRLEATKSKTDRIVVYSPEGRFEKTPHSKLPGAISRVEVVMEDDRVLA
jgi:hypothetical protein